MPFAENEPELAVPAVPIVLLEIVVSRSSPLLEPVVSTRIALLFEFWMLLLVIVASTEAPPAGLIVMPPPRMVGEPTVVEVIVVPWIVTSCLGLPVLPVDACT
jgi:hypothetical protein